MSTTITSLAAMLSLLARKEDHGILFWTSFKINDISYEQSEQRKPNLTIKKNNQDDNLKQLAKIWFRIDNVMRMRACQGMFFENYRRLLKIKILSRAG